MWLSINMWRQRKELDTSIYTNVYKDTTNRLYGIWNLLLRWKCSVFKLIWHDLVVFLFIYFALSLLYRYTNTSCRQVKEMSTKRMVSRLTL